MDLECKILLFTLLIMFALFAFACSNDSTEEILHGSLWEISKVASQVFPIKQGNISIHQYLFFAKNGYAYELILTDLGIQKILTKKDIKTEYILSDDVVKVGSFELTMINKNTLEVLDEDFPIKLLLSKVRSPSIEEAEKAEPVGIGLSIFSN